MANDSITLEITDM